MSKVKIVVVEDEVIIADNICEALTDLGYDVAEPAITYTEALQTIQDFKPDLVMLDIQLSGKKDGIDLAEVINEKYHFPYIFLTSNTDPLTVERAKKVSPAAYLAKPFSKEELYASIEIALSNYITTLTEKVSHENIFHDILFIKQKQTFVKVSLDDILYIKSDHIYVEIHLTNKEVHLLRGSLHDCLLKLNCNFIRVHRGYIVNIKQVSTFDNEILRVGETNIPFGKNFKDDFLRKVNLV
jgi:DNA-binding LytR/AlgR family response regulator